MQIRGVSSLHVTRDFVLPHIAVGGNLAPPGLSKAMSSQDVGVLGVA